jgi:hypothetical protein
MRIRDRIVEFRRVKASALRPNPRNWRTHPPAQRDALRGILAEVGYAGALLARQLPGGALELIDGHLRAETTPELEVPVLILDLGAEESDKLLAALDPLAAMAETDELALAGLIAQVETESDAVRAMFDNLLAEHERSGAEEEIAVPAEVEIPETHQVVVECRDEAEQRAVYNRLTREGFKCKLTTL